MLTDARRLEVEIEQNEEKMKREAIKYKLEILKKIEVTET